MKQERVGEEGGPELTNESQGEREKSKEKGQGMKILGVCQSEGGGLS